MAESPTRATAEQIRSLSAFSTCEISDALLKLGSPNGGHIPDLDIMSSGEEDKIVGEAYTVKMVLQGEEDHGPRFEGNYVDQAPAGSIMVISSHNGRQTLKSAAMGGLLALAASVRGVQGVVVCGRVRDLSEIRELKLPVYAKGHSTLGQSPFTRVSAVQVPLHLAEPSIPAPPVVYPFDIIVADLDGVVVVRPNEVDGVVEKATKGKEVDERCRIDLLAGKGVAETFKKHRGK